MLVQAALWQFPVQRQYPQIQLEKQKPRLKTARLQHFVNREFE
jgi:hypothetical protein